MKVFLSQGREGREKKRDGTKGRRWRGRGAGEFARRTPAARGPLPQSVPEGEVKAGARALHGPPGEGRKGDGGVQGWGRGGRASAGTGPSACSQIGTQQKGSAMDPTPPTSTALLFPTWEGEADTHCEHQKGAGRTESPGSTPVPQSHPWAAPSVPSTSPQGPSWPGGISAAVWPLTTPDPAPPYPRPLPSTSPSPSMPLLSVCLLLCTLRTRTQVRCLTQEVTFLTPPPPTHKNPVCMCVGGTVIQGFPWLLIPTECGELGNSQYPQ